MTVRSLFPVWRSRLRAMTQTQESLWPLDPTNVGTGLPLEGVRILDLSRVLAGPLSTLVASDLGADVVKVEPPTGDPVRSLAPPRVDGEATYYLSVNRNRRSVVIDLRSDDDRLFLRSLVGAADAVVENYLPSQARELGIEQMTADFPDVVWVTVAPAALGGPLGDEPSFDLLAQARSGIMGVTGSPESGPLKVGSPIADVVTGLYACIGLLTGLFARASDRSTPGLRIEAPLLESTIASLINQAGGYLGTQKAPRLLGNEHPNIVPYAPYATADRELLIAVATEAQFKSLCRALGTEAVGADPRFETNDDRVENREALRTLMEVILTTQSSTHWIGIFSEHGVPCAPVNDVPAALAQEQITSGDLVQEVTLATGSTMPIIGSPLRLDGVRPKIRKAPPLLGEDTQAFHDRYSSS